LEKIDALLVEARDERLADEVGWHGVPVGGDGHQAFAVDQHAVEDPVVARGLGQRLEVRPLGDEQRGRGLPRRIGRALLVDPPEPGRALLLQVGVIIEGAPGQKVALDELDEVFDGPLLIAGRRGAGHGMEAELHGHLLVGGVPDRLVAVVPAQRDRLHVVARDDPRHAAERAEAGDQATQQRLLLHVRREPDEHPAAVLEPRGEEVPRLPRQRRPGEGHLAHLAPVDLQQLARQPLEAHRHIAHGQSPARLAQRAHVVVEGGVAAPVRLVRVRARQFEHAPHAQALVEPAPDARLERRDLRRALARRRFLVERLAQDLGHRVAVVADELADLDVGPALLLEVMDGRAVHVSEHPSGPSALRRPRPSRSRPGTARYVSRRTPRDAAF